MDRYLIAADSVLRTLFAQPHAGRASPAAGMTEDIALTDAEKKLSGALMRVNHVGEVCAQALYAGQALATRNPALRKHFNDAALEETDHLAWTQARLSALGARPSLLNPLWYAGAFGLAWAAGKVSDKFSLGFIVETETQVAAHLQGHLSGLPANDSPSRAIVAQMQLDEERHAAEARAAGAQEFPQPAKKVMQMASKFMTTAAHYV